MIVLLGRRAPIRIGSYRPPPKPPPYRAEGSYSPPAACSTSSSSSSSSTTAAARGPGRRASYKRGPRVLPYTPAEKYVPELRPQVEVVEGEYSPPPLSHARGPLTGPSTLPDHPLTIATLGLV
jgi:hypothetical protein